MKFPDRWAEASPLLDELLEMALHTRAARLEALRQRDPRLAEVLQSLLKMGTDAEASGFLSRSADPYSPGDGGFVGRQIGPYLIEAELGSGGSGSVWLARRADGLADAVVAIKVLHTSLMGRRNALRLQQEGRILSRLAHPHIAGLMDAGTTSEGQPYLVLEYVDGVPIDQHCDAMALGIEARLRLFRDIAAAVKHAHSQFIVHRDIKPSNILVTKEGVVKLLDFGIGRLLQDDVDDLTLTANGQRALTPLYAAPEQLQGESSTAANDVYALGVLMYWLLSGRHPTAQPGATSIDVIRSTIERDPLRLSDAVGRDEATQEARAIADRRSTSVERLRQQLQGDLDAIANCALRKRPDERYESVAALAADIDRYLAHRPVTARVPSPGYVAARFVRRHRGAVAAFAVVVASIAGGVAGTLMQAHRAEIEGHKAVRQLRTAEASREFATFLLSAGRNVGSTTPELLERGARLIDQEFASDGEQRASLQLLLSELYKQSRLPSMARTMLMRARENARSLANLDLQMQIECQLAVLEHSPDGAPEAMRRADAAIATLRKERHSDPATLAGCLHGRSELVRMFGGDLDRGVRDAQTALKLLGNPSPDQQVEAVGIRTTLASLKARQGQAPAAVSEFRNALMQLENIGWGETEMAGRLHGNLGIVLYRSGQARESAHEFGRSFNILREAGYASPVAASNLARALVDIGELQGAVDVAEQAVRALSDEDGQLERARAFIPAALAWCAKGEAARCDQLLRSAREALAQVAHAPTIVLGQLEWVGAELADLRGQSSDAHDRLERAVAYFDGDKNPHRDIVKALASLARHDLVAGDLDAAKAHSERAVRLAAAGLDGFGRSAWLGSALLSQGLVQQRAGHGSAALEAFQQALDQLQAGAGEASPLTREARMLAASGTSARGG